HLLHRSPAMKSASQYALNRRRFLQAGSAAGASLILAGTQASGRVLGANDRLRIAVIGVNGRGQAHIDGYSGLDNVEIACLVDPDQRVLAQSLKKVHERAGGNSTCAGATDSRKVLDRKSTRLNASDVNSAY